MWSWLLISMPFQLRVNNKYQQNYLSTSCLRKSRTQDPKVILFNPFNFVEKHLLFHKTRKSQLAEHANKPLNIFKKKTFMRPHFFPKSIHHTLIVLKCLLIINLVCYQSTLDSCPPNYHRHLEGSEHQEREKKKEELLFQICILIHISLSSITGDAQQKIWTIHKRFPW